MTDLDKVQELYKYFCRFQTNFRKNKYFSVLSLYEFLTQTSTTVCFLVCLKKPFQLSCRQKHISLTRFLL